MTAVQLRSRWRIPMPHHRLSLRRRLLLLLLGPMLLALILDAILTYTVALTYANHVHDRGLADDAITLAQLVKRESSQPALSPQARFLLEYDPDGREYFSIRSARQGWIAGNRYLQASTQDTLVGAPPALYNTRLNHTALRAATIAIVDPQHAGSTLRVTVAENLKARHRQARQILMLAVPLQALLIVVVLLLVWFGVNSGLHVLDPLTRQLARREHDLTPIDSNNVPIELLPLTHTIDGLFTRLRGLIDLHERFIADAAHQLRTPLAGLVLQVERASAHTNSVDTDLDDALAQIRQLTIRVSRTSSQLLALTRAQLPDASHVHHDLVDLTRLIQNTIEPHLHEAWRLGIDLGYDGPATQVRVCGDAAALQELTDNLIDNALRYAGRDGVVTVGLKTSDDADTCLSVEDSGPGVDQAFLPRLGERFYQPPNALDGGTGLGLAIVRRIAERHEASVSFLRASIGGLRVEVHFTSTEPTA